MIINADDFGLSDTANAAIVESFQRGFISSTTLMPTMPGFEAACRLSHQHHLERHIGLHFTLTEGPALSQPIRDCPRLCSPDGQLWFRVPRSTPRFGRAEREALADELRAQIAKCREAGLPLTHVDSHHHAHTTWAVTTVLLAVARVEQIPWVRISRNCGAGKSLPRTLYTSLYNARLTRASVRRTWYFGSLADFRALRAEHPADYCDIEVMVHPLFDDQGNLIDKVLDQRLDLQMQDIPERDLAVSFDGSRYVP